VRSWTQLSSSPCSRSNFSFWRRRVSAMATTIAEQQTKISNRTDWATAGMVKACTVVRGPYHAPAAAKRIARTDGPTPQYHAEKAIAGKTSTKTVASPVKRCRGLLIARAMRTEAVASP
jgi:hypothetical protein